MQYSLKNGRREKCRYGSQPRSQLDPEHVRGLSASMKSIGQQVPILGYTDPTEDIFIVTNGGCRMAAAELADIPELLALDLGKKPTPQELLMAQAHIDHHHLHLPTMDRARLWEGIRKERGCTARQLAKELGV